MPRSRRCSRWSAASSTSTRPSPTTARGSPTCRCWTAWTARSRSCARRPARRRSSSWSPTPRGWATGSGARTWRGGRRSPASRTSLSGSNVMFKAPLLADPGTTYNYGINTDWLGKVVEAASGVDARRGGQGGHHRPARDGPTTGSCWPTSGRPTRSWCTSRARTATGPRPATTSTRSRSGGQAGTACTPPRATTSASSGRCSRRRARRRPHPRASPPWTRRSPTRSASWTSRRHPHRRPGIHRRLQPRPGLQVGLRPAAQHRGHPGHAPGRHRGVGRAVQHPLLGRPHAGICASIYSNFLPFVPPEALELYPDFEGALRLALNRAKRADRAGLPGADISAA